MKRLDDAGSRIEGRHRSTKARSWLLSTLSLSTLAQATYIAFKKLLLLQNKIDLTSVPWLLYSSGTDRISLWSDRGGQALLSQETWTAAPELHDIYSLFSIVWPSCKCCNAEDAFALWKPPHSSIKKDLKYHSRSRDIIHHHASITRIYSNRSPQWRRSESVV